MRQHQISTQTYNIITQYGDMQVVKQGIHQPHHHHHHSHHHPLNNSASVQQSSGSEPQQQPASAQPTRPVIMTFHDLGLNSELQFATFCECEEVKLMLQTFTIIHVNFIGQEFDSKSQPVAALPDDFKYPTVEQMAECIVDICAQLRVRSFVGLAVGAGAHIVSTLALIRPDLVHGLFLINPVMSSCSITEWLYFKMSAIASNPQILGGGHHPGLLSTQDDQRQSFDSHHQDHHQKLSSSGFKKLWNAMHLHHSQQQQQNANKSIDPSLAGGSSTGDDNESDADPNQSPSLSPLSTQQQGGTGQQQVSSLSNSATKSPAASSRLRQLILSRNFRVGRHSHNQHQNSQRSTPMRTCDTSLSSLSIDNSSEQNCFSTPTSSTSSGGAGDRGEPKSLEVQPARREPTLSPRRASNAADSPQPKLASGRRPSGGSQLSSVSAQSMGNKRPPVEYLMYHHFGAVSFQRFSRLSDVQASSGCSSSSLANGEGGGGEVSNAALADASGDSEEAAKVRQLREELAKHRDSCDSNASSRSVKSLHQASLKLADQERPGLKAGASEFSPGRRRTRSSSASHRLQRSNSICLSASYLASISSDRQRAAYMQMVYKQYFGQINSHNLWLFAQSFVKRRSLNLRKDCGAAAHAAAAAAALGTSICAAFVGVGPHGQCAFGAPSPSSDFGTSVGQQQLALDQSSKRSSSSTRQQQVPTSSEDKLTQQHTKSASEGGGHSAKTPGSTTTTTRSAVASKELPKQQALVAGTKVKRTFTCQTLIMCSSVHIHRKRAVNLMSLLNPMQATWIRTDQLLVLEEKPEKVCQALRLFLQGIGYSMSTYERRLRLSSAQASVSSADSDGSARSLNLEPSATSASLTADPIARPAGQLQQKMST